MVCTEGLSNDSIVYSVGIGFDISFDVALHRAFGVHIFAFDPTFSRERRWKRLLSKYGLKDSSHFRFMQLGLGGREALLPIFRPSKGRGPLERSQCTSASAEAKRRAEAPVAVAAVARLPTLMLLQQHAQVRLLKMDIEGAEFSVLANTSATRQWLRTAPPDQIAVEFHERFGGSCHSAAREAAVALLRACGFSVRYISPNREEMLFVRSALPSPVRCAA